MSNLDEITSTRYVVHGSIQPCHRIIRITYESFQTLNNERNQDSAATFCPSGNCYHREEVKLKSEDSNSFKTCSCGCSWSQRNDFLDDESIELIGYTPNFKALEMGWFFFNHHTCKSTLAIKAAHFIDLYQGEVFTDRKTGSDDCPGYCLRQSELAHCPAKCECAYVRQLLQIIKHWDKRSGMPHRNTA